MELLLGVVGRAGARPICRGLVLVPYGSTPLVDGGESGRRFEAAGKGGARDMKVVESCEKSSQCALEQTEMVRLETEWAYNLHSRRRPSPRASNTAINYVI